MKNIKTELRRAFTIVELVIVIVVIAALAAVLIPTFANVINAANESADTSLVKNLNTSLVAVEGQLEKNNDGIYNVTEAITLVRNDGYDVSKLTPSADNADIVYNASTNRFLYYTDNFADLSLGEEPDSDDVLVVIDNTLSRIATVSASESLISGNTVHYCVYSTDSEVSVENSTDEIIVWLYSENNATVSINLPKGTVYQYGVSNTTTVVAVDSENSYHPFATINIVYFQSGKYDYEEKGNVGYIYIASENASNVTVNNLPSTTVIYSDSSTSIGDLTTVNINLSYTDTATYEQYSDVFSDWEYVAATCEEDGYFTYTSIFGGEYTETYAATGHSYVTETKDYVDDYGTVYNDGTITTCSNCDYSAKSGGNRDTSGMWTYTSGTTSLSKCYIDDDTYLTNASSGIDIVIPYGTTKIGDGNSGDDGIFSTSNYNFSLSINSIDLPETLTYIGDYAFYEQKITSVDIPSSVTYIGVSAFYNCDNLTSIVIPDSVTEIAANAFDNCTNLTTVTISENSTLEKIGNQAFYYCTKLTSIIIPSSVTSIGSEAFFTASKALESIYYLGTATQWDDIQISYTVSDIHKDGLYKFYVATSTYYATVYFYSEESTRGNYWRYVDGVPTAWNK